MTIPPQRLLDSTPETAEDRLLAKHFGAVQEPETLPPLAVERISRAVSSGQTARRGGASRTSRSSRFFDRRLLWVLVIGTPLAFAGVWTVREGLAPGLARARNGARVAMPVPKPVLEELPVAPAEEAPVSSVAPLQPEPVPVAAKPAPALQPNPRRLRSAQRAPDVAAPVPTPQQEPVVVAEAPSPVTEAPPAAVQVDELDALVEESGLVRRALEQLRSEGDGVAALATLEEYAQRFPSGQLRAEAAVARVDALLVLQRHADALGELRRISNAERAGLPRRLELQVLEAELLSRVGQCEQAIRHLRGKSFGDSPLEERSLFVRATCEARAQRTEEARALFEELLRRWPNGAQAGEARRALGQSP